MNGIIKRIAEQGVLPLVLSSRSYGKRRSARKHCMRPVSGRWNTPIGAKQHWRISNCSKRPATRSCPELLLGIGTIKRKKEAKAFMKAGADFIIAPGMIEEVAETVHKEDMLWIPGCMTTTEIIRAEDAGAKLIKLFPGNLAGAFLCERHQRTFSRPASLCPPVG